MKTLGEIKAELAKIGKTLRYVGQSWQRCYIARVEMPDEDRIAWGAAKNCKYFADYYVCAPSWRSTTYSHRNYYRIVDLEG